MRVGWMGKGLGVLGGLGLLGAVVVASEARLRDEPEPVDPASELVYLPDARLLRPLVLGFDNALADILWFRTISYFGRHYDADRSYPWLARMCDVVTDLDPRAEHVYRFAGFILPWEANEVDEGIRLLEKGVRALPDRWTLPYYLGIVRYFFKDEHGAAAEDLRRAAALPGAPAGVAHMAAVLHAQEHGGETTIAFLREMARQDESPQLKKVIERSLRDVRYRIDVERLTGLVAAHRDRHGAPPPSLDALVRDGALERLPPDPFGGVYELNPATGMVRSSTGKKPRELRTSPMKERYRRSQQSRAEESR